MNGSWIFQQNIATHFIKSTNQRVQIRYRPGMSCSTLIIHFKRKIILICAIDGSKNAAEKCVSVITLTQNTI